MSTDRLVELVEKKEWSEAQKLLAESENARFLVTASDEHDCVPLHIAVREGAPDDLILALIDVCEETIIMKNEKYRTPCHYAAYFGVSDVVIESMIARCPLALDEPDEGGKVPRDLDHGRLTEKARELVEKPVKLVIDEQMRAAKAECLSLTKQLAAKGEELASLKQTSMELAETNKQSEKQFIDKINELQMKQTISESKCTMLEQRCSDIQNSFQVSEESRKTGAKLLEELQGNILVDKKKISDLEEKNKLMDAELRMLRDQVATRNILIEQLKENTHSKATKMLELKRYNHLLSRKVEDLKNELDASQNGTMPPPFGYFGHGDLGSKQILNRSSATEPMTDVSRDSPNSEIGYTDNVPEEADTSLEIGDIEERLLFSYLDPPPVDEGGSVGDVIDGKPVDIPEDVSTIESPSETAEDIEAAAVLNESGTDEFPIEKKPDSVEESFSPAEALAAEEHVNTSNDGPTGDLCNDTLSEHNDVLLDTDAPFGTEEFASELPSNEVNEVSPEEKSDDELSHNSGELLDTSDHESYVSPNESTSASATTDSLTVDVTTVSRTGDEEKCEQELKETEDCVLPQDGAKDEMQGEEKVSDVVDGDERPISGPNNDFPSEVSSPVRPEQSTDSDVSQNLVSSSEKIEHPQIDRSPINQFVDDGPEGPSEGCLEHTSFQQVDTRNLCMREYGVIQDTTLPKRDKTICGSSTEPSSSLSQRILQELSQIDDAPKNADEGLKNASSRVLKLLEERNARRRSLFDKRPPKEVSKKKRSNLDDKKSSQSSKTDKPKKRSSRQKKGGDEKIEGVVVQEVNVIDNRLEGFEIATMSEVEDHVDFNTSSKAKKKSKRKRAGVVTP